MATITREGLIEHWERMKKQREANFKKKNKTYTPSLQKEDRIRFCVHIIDKVKNSWK